MTAATKSCALPSESSEARPEEVRKDEEKQMSDNTRIYSAPGRTEIAGNHCDHQKGRVIAAAVDMDITAVVAPREDTLVSLCSDVGGFVTVDLADTQIHEEEKGTAAALIRGVAAWFAERGYALSGFSADVTSRVPTGAGVSSSAAFEVLAGTILTDLSDRGTAPAPVIAIAGQYAENVYFGKPSGLMDQMACALDGATYMDFARHAQPVFSDTQAAGTEIPYTEKVALDPRAHGYALFLVNTGGSHADLTDAYAAIPNEMRAVAASFGKGLLSEVDAAAFYEAAPSLKKTIGERPVLRAQHYYEEVARVDQMRDALRLDDFTLFLSLVNASGRSSERLLQNIVPDGASGEQPLAAALMLSEKLLAGKGAWRVHGGGFAGTIQAYVPLEKTEEFRAGTERAFGSGCCMEINIRKG